MRLGVFVACAVGILLQACSQHCGNADVAGIYQMHEADDIYELKLTSDGNGTVSLNGTEIGVLTWKSEPATDQVFFRTSESVLERLRHLAHPESGQEQGKNARGGYFGVTPMCGSDQRVAKSLSLNVDDEQRSFVRVSGESNSRK